MKNKKVRVHKRTKKQEKRYEELVMARVKKEEFEDIFVTNGKVEVLMFNEKGRLTGRTELLLTDVWIKIPKTQNPNRK